MKIAFLGAGFTRNWGGWLASELVGEICGRVIGDPQLLQKLKNTRNFERVLADSRQAANRGPSEEKSFLLLQKAVLETFDEMNGMLARQRFEFPFSPPERRLVTFLSEFDVIFTLNQDLLLEIHYRPGSTIPPHKNWEGTCYPGIDLPGNWERLSNDERAKARLKEIADFDCAIERQPIYKLHGSVNWQSKDGTSILVVGDGKDEAIRGSTILSRYFNTFENNLNSGETKLMVIGYSFSDSHINNVIERASENSGLRTYLIDPAGLTLFDSPPSNVVKPRSPVFDALTIAGILTRPFRGAFNDDDLAFASIWRFLRS